MIYPARATTREARTLDTAGRGRARALQSGAGGAGIAGQQGRTSAATAPTPAPRPFQSSLWDAFSGTPARTATPSATANPPSPAGNSSPAASPAAATASTGARVAAATSAATPRSGSDTTTRTSTQNATETTNTTPATPPDVLSQVRAALNSVGLNPDQYNLRLGSMTISFPNIPTYEYPVLYADINGQTSGFYLNGVAQNPGMFAVNVSSMIGRPISYQV